MEFCPTCANLLQYNMCNPASLFCRACPYKGPIVSKVKLKRGVQLTNKEAAPIAPGVQENVGPTTDATCKKCGHGKAGYEQRQIRSADEPMTTFYQCLKCRHIWTED